MSTYSDTPLARLKSIAEWAHTTENTRVSVRKEDLWYAMEKIAYLEMILGEDIDINDPLPDEAADLSNEEEAL